MESFINHIKVEIKALGKDKNPLVKAWLNESQGIPSQMDSMLQALVTDNPYLKKNYRMWQENPSIPATCRFDMYSCTKDIKRNYLGPKSMLTVRFSRKSYRPHTGGTYVGAITSAFNRDSGLLDKASINLQCDTHPSYPFEEVQEALRITLAHELLHAFEDFNRQCLGVRSLQQALSDRNYSSADDQEDVMQWFTYILDPAEQRAFIAGTVQEIRDGVRKLAKAGRLDRIEKIRDIYPLLKSVELWPMYMGLKHWVEDTQWERLPKWQQDDLLKAYNKLVTKDENSPLNSAITTYNQMVKKIKYRWSSFDERLKKAISKAVTTALYDSSPKDPKLVGENSLKNSIIYQAY